MDNTKELRNRPHYAIDKEIADESGYKIPKGSSISINYNDPTSPIGGQGFDNIPSEWILIPSENKRILYDGRYTAVSAYIYTYFKGHWYVLANKRGENAPDYKHCWNIVCGFLERNESGEQGIKREVYEETGFVFNDEDKFTLIGVETEPEKCNNGNVSLQYAYLADWHKIHGVFDYDYETTGMPGAELRGGEEKEVEDVEFVAIDNLDKYKWAFNHRETIPEVFKMIPWYKKQWIKIKYYAKYIWIW